LNLRDRHSSSFEIGEYFLPTRELQESRGLQLLSSQKTNRPVTRPIRFVFVAGGIDDVYKSVSSKWSWANMAVPGVETYPDIIVLKHGNRTLSHSDFLQDVCKESYD
jgi:hypothetical protein